MPARRTALSNRHRLAAPAPRDWDRTRVAGSLAELGPVRIAEVSGQHSEREERRAALATFRYLVWVENNGSGDQCTT